MKSRTRACRVFLLLVGAIVVVAFGCSPASVNEQAPATEPDIRGVLTRVNISIDSKQFLVEENPSDQAGSAKASVRIVETTRILERTADGVVRSDATALATGQQVSVWFDGPVMESYPVQAKGGVVLIETR